VCLWLARKVARPVDRAIARVACVCFACLGRRRRECPRVDRVRAPPADSPARPGERAVVGGRESLKALVTTVERVRAPARHFFRRLAGIAACDRVNDRLLQIVSHRRWERDIESIGRRVRRISRGGLFGLVVFFVVTRQWAGRVRPERQGQSATDREEQCHGKHHDSRAHTALIGVTKRELETTAGFGVSPRSPGVGLVSLSR
jgi:hypothetical protein